MYPVSEFMTYVWKCSDCSREGSHSKRVAALNASEAHYQEHQASKIVGKAISGQVFNTLKHDSWLGHVTKGEEIARSKGFAYFEWNGYVFPTIGMDFSKPLCSAKDVPSLKEDWEGRP